MRWRTREKCSEIRFCHSIAIRDSVKENLGVGNVGVPEVGRVAIDPEEEADRSSVPTDWWSPGTPGVGCPIDSEGARPSNHVRYRPIDRPKVDYMNGRRVREGFEA